MDVFSAVAEGPSRAHLREAARQAAHELGVFAALARGPINARTLAAKLGLPREHRLHALLEVLVLEKLIAADEDSPARYSLEGKTAPAASARSLPALGWGRLAEVIRRDRPLDEAGVRGTRSAAAGEEDSLERFHQHLFRAGADAAAELMTDLAKREGGTLLDLGSGAGAYSRAWLSAGDDVKAILLDRPDVLALAEEGTDPNHWHAKHLAEGRVSPHPIDLFDAAPWPRANLVLLANLLHLFGPEDSQRLVSRAAESVAPGGLVVIKDLLLESDRSGPAAGVLFSLNMALFTEEGRVHGKEALLGFLRDAGLVDLRARSISAAPDAVAVEGRRPLEQPSGLR